MMRFAFMFACLILATYGPPAVAVYWTLEWDWWPVARLTLAAILLFNIELRLLLPDR